MSFEPSLARRGLDALLALHPHLDLLSAKMPGDKGYQQYWLEVELGQPSESGMQAWARWPFAIFIGTGAVYGYDPDGAVSDDPIIEVS